MSGVAPIDRVLAHLQDAREAGIGWSARCPSHQDLELSLSIGVGDDGRLLLHCEAGCSVAAIVVALGLDLADLFEKSATGPHTTAAPGLTLAQLAAAEQLPVEFLQELGCRDVPGPSVRIPYYDRDGNEVAVRTRLALDAARFRWRTGDHAAPYGLERLADARRVGWLVLVPSESDCWACWYHGIPALGIPGKSTWREAWASHLSGLEVYLWQEPEAEDLVARVAADLPDVRLMVAPSGAKDVSEAHVRGDNVPDLLERLRRAATPARELLAEAERRRLRDSYHAAEPVLAHRDPLQLVEAEIRAQGFGGDARAPVLGYLAATSRVLKPRRGSMPAHAVFKGPSSSGKNAALSAALRLLPEEACHVIDAGSPRVLIYEEAELVHRVVVFSEADSLPAGEDNPAASAVRNLLADGDLHYKVTERDPASGRLGVRTVVRAGPSVLLTTSTGSLGTQLMTRLFTIEVPDEPQQLRAALAAQAAMELDDPPPPNEALIAFQRYLQASAPIDVVVPFAKQLSAHLGRGSSQPRVLRDYPRLLSLIKAVAVLRIAQRVRDSRGRIVATLDDYAAVHPLVADAYQASTGASARVRDAVAAVRTLTTERPVGSTVTVTEVANSLGVSVPSATRRVRDAIAGGWLVNEEVRRSQKAMLRLGEPLPETSLLPSRRELEAQQPDLESSPAQAQASAGEKGQGGAMHPPVSPENVKTAQEPITHEPHGVFTISPDTVGSDDWVDVEPPADEPPGQQSLWGTS
jgi:hypothetical protein